MEDVRYSPSAPAMLALAVVVRQFEGSRVERQVLAQVFDLVWQVERAAVSRVRCAVAQRVERAAPRNRSRHRAEAVVRGASEKGGGS